MSTWSFKKCDTTENSLDELIKQMGWIMSKLDSKNVKRLDTNETSIKSALGETYINGPVLQMYDNQSPRVLRLQQGYDSTTTDFLYELYNKSGVKTVGIDSNGDGTFTGSISASSFTGGTIAIGSGNNIFKADSNGIYLGNATFASAPFSVAMDGSLKSSDAEITGGLISIGGATGKAIIETVGSNGAFFFKNSSDSEVGGLYRFTYVAPTLDDITLYSKANILIQSDNDILIEALGDDININCGHAYYNTKEIATQDYVTSQGFLTGNSVNGSFTSADGKTVSVANGLVTGIV